MSYVLGCVLEPCYRLGRHLHFNSSPTINRSVVNHVGLLNVSLDGIQDISVGAALVDFSDGAVGLKVTHSSGNDSTVCAWIIHKSLQM